MTTRVSPPANKSLGVNPITVNAGSGAGNNSGPGNSGRTYSCAVGATLDVPDHDAYVMSLNGWVSHGQVTTTTARPTSGIAKNAVMIDSTLGAAIMWDGTQWRNYLTGAVV